MVTKQRRTDRYEPAQGMTDAAGGRPVLLAGLSSLLDTWSPGLAISLVEDSVSREELAPYVRVGVPQSERWFAVLVAEDDFQEAASALQSGACAVVTLYSSIAELQAAVAALDGKGPPFLAATLLRGLVHGALDKQEDHRAASGGAPRLTKREQDVLALLSQGYTNREIATELVVSVNTIRSHVHALGDKLGGSSRARIVLNARAAGLADFGLMS